MALRRTLTQTGSASATSTATATATASSSPIQPRADPNERPSQMVEDDEVLKCSIVQPIKVALCF
jgi:hypothetical protein